jgi:micrococcal nuclease
MFTYAVKEVVKVVDGDTVDVVLDLGFGVSIKQRIRVKGINCAETRTRDVEEKGKGLTAKAFAEDWFSHGELIVRTHKDDKYGRMLGEFFRGEENFAESAIFGGFAVAYDGGKR